MRPLLPILIIATTLLMSCQDSASSTAEHSSSEKEESFQLPDSLSSRRISFVLKLREHTAARCWPQFAQKATEGSLIYFNGNKSEVFFPNGQLKSKLSQYEEYSKDYLLTNRTDSLPFHMEVMISLDQSDSAALYYRNPVEQYLSVAEINKYIPSVETTEMWSTMVLHEMFHHFQYNNEQFRQYAETEIASSSFNSNNLVALCQSDKSFLKQIQAENKDLMQALASQAPLECDSLISSYLQKRKQRITAYGAEYPELEKIENYYIIQEGSARYAEYHSMFVLRDFFKSAQPPIIKEDPLFSNYSEFEEIDLESDAFNYLVYAGSTDYHYTLGFNMMRLLDILDVEYKSTLLNRPEKGLHEYLNEYLSTKKTTLPRT